LDQPSCEQSQQPAFPNASELENCFETGIISFCKKVEKCPQYHETKNENASSPRQVLLEQQTSGEKLESAAAKSK
jgi:hypothetical protein